MKNKKMLLLSIAILLALAGCRFDRIINPDLPTYTPTIFATPQPTLTPTPTPIPTPEPGTRIEEGDAALFSGNWDKALEEYSIAFDMSGTSDVKAAALLGLGRTYYQMGSYEAALNTFTTAILEYANTPHTAPLYFALGETYESLGQPIQAAESFKQYLDLRPGLIDYYLYERIGDNFYSAENYSEAIEAYASAINAQSINDTLFLSLLIGDAYTALGNYEDALTTYDSVYNQTANDYVKAEARRKVADIKLEQGLTDEAYGIYQEIVQQYPAAYDAYLAITTLLDADIPVNDLDRGLINYFVKQYGFAIDAFVRYLKDNPDEHSVAAHYYLGFAYQAQGEQAKAIESWQEIIDNHVNERFWPEAFDEIAYTKSVYLEDPEGGIDVYLDFVDRSPLHERSPEFLYYAARTAERNYDLKTAAALWERIGTQFSTSSWAYDGLFQAGIALYRLGQYENAMSMFQSSLGVADDRGGQAAGYFWIGKCYQSLNNASAAEESWRQASTSDPTGYYSQRADDILAGIAPFTAPASFTKNIDWGTERAEAETWMIQTFALPADQNLRDITPLLSDPRMIRGGELWNLGQYELARAEFESYRQAVQTDPLKTYLLANYLIDLGLYRSGIIAARQVLDLAGYDDAGTFNAPIYFNHLRFGFYFPDIIFPAAEENGLNPIFLYSVIRQESLFEGFVTSTAGARGLMQIIPSTGESIANRLNWPSNFKDTDLYRPYINVPLGAAYLDQQRDYFSQDLYVAMAAYNGGPGNASNWLSLANNDPDLFVEVIRFEETRNYIRYIYEIYDIYVDLYSN